jgi:hypothetical protein
VRIAKRYKEKLGYVIDRLMGARTTLPDGSVGFNAVEHEFCLSVLESAIDFQPVIPEPDRRGLIRDAVRATAARAKPTLSDFEQQLQQYEAQYLKKPLQAYLLASSLGIRDYRGRRTAQLDGVSISFHPVLPKKFNRSSFKEKIEECVPPSPERILQIVARVSARTPTAAFENARMNIDLLRAIWCFIVQSRSFKLLHIGPPQPVTAILPGPLHTLHLMDGSPALDLFWFEPEGLMDRHVINGAEWPQIDRRTSQILTRLRTVPYRRDLERALVFYVRSLDTRDAGNSFGNLWSVLELVTDSIGKYDQLVRRACFLYSDVDRPFMRLVLEHLRDVRNHLVHEQGIKSNIDSYLQQLKSITEGLIRFHLVRGREYPSLVLAAEFLDTPTDRQTLERRLRDYRRTLRKRK